MAENAGKDTTVVEKKDINKPPLPQTCNISQEDIEVLKQDIADYVELTESIHIGKLGAALAKARIGFEKLEQTGLIKKNWQDGNGNWKKAEIPYSTIDDMLKSTESALQKNGLAMLSKINLSNNTTHVTLKLLHCESEQFMQSELTADVKVIGKEALLQAFGRTKTYLLRNAYSAMLLISTDEGEPDIIEVNDEPQQDSMRYEKMIDFDQGNRLLSLAAAKGMGKKEFEEYVLKRTTKDEIIDLTKDEADAIELFLSN